MSATNRGAKRSPKDYYKTPDWAVEAILPHLHVRGDILDPGCGDGAITKALLAHGADILRIVGVEADKRRAKQCGHGHVIRVIVGDFLKVPLPRTFDLAIGNPPYLLAREFAERAFTAVGRTGTVAFLLRLNWLASAERKGWHRRHPCDVYVLPRRPSFGLNKHGKRGTDGTEYAWFVWGPGRGGRYAILDVAESER